MKKANFKTICHGLMLTMAVGVVSVAAGSVTVEACTSYYAGKNVTADGSIMFGRTEDIGGSHSKIFKVYEAASHAEGEMYTDVTSFTMPLPEQTYRYTVCEDDPGYGGDLFGEVGTNEFGVSMSATESASPLAIIGGSRREPDLKPVDAFVNTGITESSMVNAVLPCIKTAREGVEFLAGILDEYGAGEGNTLMFADQEECWYMEILSGHQYAAIKMPDDKAAMMPNCFMIETIDVTDTENVIASEGLISTAEAAGTLDRDGETDPNKIHVAHSYSGAMGSGNSYRIWGGQIIFNPDLAETLSPTQEDFDMFVTPKEKVDVPMIYKIAGTQYEGTDEYGGSGRVIGSSGSCECHVFQIRPDMPTELATIEWLSMGSADLSPFIPYYSAAITDTHPAYKIGDTNYNPDSAYWAFRSVASLSVSAESREVAAVNVKDYWTKYVASLADAQVGVDSNMLALYETDPTAVYEKATNLGMAVADETIGAAKQIYNELLAKIASGNGKITRTYVPSLLTKEIYSTYSYDMVYTPQATISPEEYEALNADLQTTKAELAAAQTEVNTAKAEAAAAKEAYEKLQKKVNATKITTSKKNYSVKKGKKVTIKATVKNAAGKKVTWKSSNKKVAKVTAKGKKGVVKGLKKGKATITIKCNGVSTKVKVTVK